MAPPLRTERDVEALRKAVSEGLVDVIATDHAPHGMVDKAVEFDQAANGIVGLQTAVPLTLGLVHQGIVSPLRWVAALSEAPARLLRLPLGSLKVGAFADVTILDPSERWTLRESDLVSKSLNSPFLGWEFEGRVKSVVLGGVLHAF
jgi:dihydroorotase